MSIAEQSEAGVRILATAGDMLLGGDDLTWAVAQKLNQCFVSTVAVDVFAVDDSCVAAQGLRGAAEDALQTLSIAPEALIVLDHGAGSDAIWLRLCGGMSWSAGWRRCSRGSATSARSRLRQVLQEPALQPVRSRWFW